MTQLASSSFPGADENPLSEGGNWVQLAAFGLGNIVKLVSNSVGNAATNQDSWAVYDGGISWPTQQYCEWKITTVGSGDGGPTINVDTATGNGYHVNHNNGLYFQLYKFTGGGFVNVDSSTNPTALAVNDVVRLTQLAGGVIEVKLNGSVIISYTDGTPFSGGKPGVGIFDGTIRLDDFAAGDTLTGPVINTNPVNAACYVSQTVNFSVAATTSGGTLHYQWKDDGSNVGTDSNSYTTAAAVASDNGAQITCAVSDDNGSNTSAAATWTVYPVSSIGWISA